MGRQPWRRRTLRRLCYGWADRVFCVSQELREYYHRELGLTNFLEVIPNGVDVEQFRPNLRARMEIRRQLGAERGTLVVGTVGRLDPVKDHPTLFQAAEIALRKGLDLQLVVVGDGVQRRFLENDLEKRSGLSRHAVLVGEVRNVADWLNSFDVFVLPSLSEGMSNTLLEAMAVGIVPIATAVGGNTEVIEDGHSGLLVQPKDAEKICEYLVRLALAEGWRCALGRNARELVATRFSLDRMLKQYEEMYCLVAKQDNAIGSALSRA